MHTDRRRGIGRKADRRKHGQLRIRVGEKPDPVVLLRETDRQGHAAVSARPQLSVRLEGIHQGNATDRRRLAVGPEEIPLAAPVAVLVERRPGRRVPVGRARTHRHQLQSQSCGLF